MSNRFFKPVDIPSSEPTPKKVSRVVPKTHVVQTDEGDSAHNLKNEVKDFHSVLMRMIGDVESGASTLVRTAIKLSGEKTGSPLIHCIQEFHSMPSTDNLKRVLNLLQTDINRRFKQEVENIILSGSYPAIKKLL